MAKNLIGWKTIWKECSRRLMMSTILHAKKLGIVILSSFIYAVGMNLFLVPANIYSGGVTGLAQLISNLTQDFTPFIISTGLLVLLLNIPITILGWYKIGKLFTFYSFISVVAMSLFLHIIPVSEQSDDILLNSVFGGAITAIGVGLALKWGASTGGLDIIALILSRMKDRPIGTYLFALNGVIIVTAGAVYTWERALYTLVTLYASTRFVDSIHTGNRKVTILIITDKCDEMENMIRSRLVRGMTIIPAIGAFSRQPKNILMIVMTKYELFDLAGIVNDVDPSAFTNVVQTEEVLGFFRR